MNGFGDNDMSEFFCMAKDRHNVNTRGASEGLFVPQQTRLDIRKFFFLNRVVNAWNELPFEIRDASGVNAFKNLYDLYMTTIRLINDYDTYYLYVAIATFNHLIMLLHF